MFGGQLPCCPFWSKILLQRSFSISIMANVGNFSMVKDVLSDKKLTFYLDLDLDGLSSIYEVKALVKTILKRSLLFTQTMQNNYMLQMPLKLEQGNSQNF